MPKEHESSITPDNNLNDGGKAGDATALNPMEELGVLGEVMAALQKLPNTDARGRVLQAAVGFFRMALPGSAGPTSLTNFARVQEQTSAAASSFSEDRTISPKDFLMQKQPRTDVERVACLAYYLTHYRNIPHFKTIDISKLNTDAAQPKFSNAAVAMDNAARSHYLVPASKGNRQLSAAGEIFVQVLPERDAAKAAMAGARPRRRKKLTQSNSANDDSGE